MSTELGLSLARCSAAAPQRRRPAAPRLVVEGMPREQAAPWAGGAHGVIHLISSTGERCVAELPARSFGRAEQPPCMAAGAWHME
jgi:hypothetical protein